MAPRRTELTASPDSERLGELLTRLRTVAPDRRSETAARLCGDDGPLLAELTRLLPHAQAGDRFLSPPAAVVWRSPDDEVGRVLGRRWELVRLIGVGGRGEVFEARDVESGRRAALKLVHGLSRERARAVRREIAFLRWLRLPGVVHLLDDGAEDGAVYCVMELARGLPFPGPRVASSWRELEPIALALLEVVARVHAAGVAHCDLKPANVLVDERGAVTLLDLGISTDRSPTSGGRPDGIVEYTPGYAAPEQLAGGRADRRSDLYAVGVMLFEAVAGRRPGPEGARDCAALAAPPRVRRAIASLLAPQRRRRPRSAREVIDLVQPPPPPPQRGRRWTEIELRERIAGPDLLLHLREDAAAELLRRTDGRPRDVEREIDSWTRAGLARVETGLVVIDRPAIERLRLQSESNRRRPGGAGMSHEGWFAHSLRHAGPREIASGARLVAARWLARGRPSAAMTVIFEGAVAARAVGDERLEIAVLREATATALRTAMSSELDRALLLLQRASSQRSEVRDMETVVRAALHYAAGRPHDAVESVRAPCEQGANVAIQRLAWSVRNSAARALGLDAERRCVVEMRGWIRRSRVRGSRSFLATAQGWVRYRESRFRASVALHLEAWRTASDEHARIRCLLDAAAAAGACDHADAGRLAERARRRSVVLRNAVHEGRALHLARCAILRKGSVDHVDHALVEAAVRVGFPVLTAGIALTEAAVAWRIADPRAARSLAMTAARHWGASPSAHAARALAAAAGQPSDDDALERSVAAATSSLPPAVGVQVLALLVLARPAWSRRLRLAARHLRVPPGTGAATSIREILSIAEARAILER